MYHRSIKPFSRLQTIIRLARTPTRFCVATLLTVGLMTGCASQKATVCDLDYCDDITGINDYRAINGKIAYPCISKPTAEAVAVTMEPRTLRRRIDDKSREITLFEALRLAMTQNQVLETSAFGGIGAKAVLTNPQSVATVYDPAIQSSGVLFGRRSVESALADFDTTFTSSLTWQRSDLNSGGSMAGGGNRTDFTSGLRKQFANGGTVSLNHDVSFSGDVPDYDGNEIEYYGTIGASYRQPLLAGSGVDYTRIAGPANPNFGSITGVSQGVVIARINEDISIADFELAVRNAMQDIEDAYWDLYLTYRNYDTAVVAHKSVAQTWTKLNNEVEVGRGLLVDRLQAEDVLYESKAVVENGLNALYKAEAELRRLIGLPMNDGTVLVPIDDPVMAEFVPDWNASLRQGLTRRTELRRQKWAVKSLQLQLQAARSLVRPRFDLIAGYDVHGAGDKLLSQSGSPFQGVYGSMNNDNINSWNVGVELSVPLGYRFTRSQVRNLELQVAKATAVLSSQEKNIAHDIATAIQDLTSAYAASQSNHKRLKAAAERVPLEYFRYEEGGGLLDDALRADRSRALAESAYYTEIINYNKAITALDLATGTLLENNGIYLAEGKWDPAAYCDAELRAHARTHAKDAPHLKTMPADFSSPGPTGQLNLRAPESTGSHESVPAVPPTPEEAAQDAVQEILPPDVSSKAESSRTMLSPSEFDPELLDIMPPAVMNSRRIVAQPASFSEDFPKFQTTTDQRN